jgi:hypothetical protein
MATRKPDLAAALADHAGSTRRRPQPAPPPTASATEPGRIRPEPYRQPSRGGTAPITVHMPKEVRRQLKLLSAELDRKMGDLLAEALNDLFAKHGKPEVAPREAA